MTGLCRRVKQDVLTHSVHGNHVYRFELLLLFYLLSQWYCCRNWARVLHSVVLLQHECILLGTSLVFAQLFVTCSMIKQEMAKYLSSHEHEKLGKWLKLNNQCFTYCSIKYILNAMQYDMLSSPSLLDMCGKLRGTFTVLHVHALLYLCTTNKPFLPILPSFLSKNTRFSPTLLYCKQWKAGQVSGNEANCSPGWYLSCIEAWSEILSKHEIPWNCDLSLAISREGTGSVDIHSTSLTWDSMHFKTCHILKKQKVHSR